MDQETEESTQGQSTPVTDDALEPEVSWSVKEEPEDEPSAVHSNDTSGSPNTVQPVPNKAGSLNRSNSCQRCAAVFMLPRSLTVHMQTVHGETDRTKLPAASKRREDTEEDAKQTPSELGRSSPQGSDNSREEFTMSAHNFTIKLEPTWSEDEEQDEPSAVYSTVQPMSDNTSGSLLSLNITSHVCPHCLDSFVLFSSLELHMATFHGETLRDTFPVFPTSYYAGMGYHGDSGTEIVGGYGNWHMDDMMSFETEPERKSKRHRCNMCNKAFSRSNDLKKHMLIHTGQKPFVCDICNKAFTQSTDMKRHKLLHTNYKPFACELCDKGFIQSSHLKRHMMIHAGYKPHECDICGKGFTTNCEMTKHRLIHSGQRPYVCDVCDRAFSRVSHLNAHKLIHIGHKPFVCDVCNKAFIRDGDLKAHRMIHADEKPFVCDICNKAFVRVDYLKKHRFTHSGIKRFACDICDKAFTRNAGLQAHKAIHERESLGQ